MEIIITIIVIGIVIYVLKNKNSQVVLQHTPILGEKLIVGYRKKLRIMSESESALFFELKKQISPNYYIFPNMRLADIVDAVNGYGFYKRRNKILPKHVDFVVCNSVFKPIVAIELNGNSHNRQDRLEKDEEKKKILEEAQIPLITIKVGDNFNESVLKIKDAYLKQ